jgi:TolB-like protein/class 3 adenylate cyclase/tetratricopeptide (TPR) repeat protein
MAEERMERRLSAILAADIAGYSALMGADEARTVRDLKGHQSVVLPMIGEFVGRIIDTAGDGILAEFPSVVNAVKCALAIQSRMAERNAAIEPERRMQFRVGLNIGDVVYDETRIYGDGINVAARLEGIAEAGGICISSKVYEEISGRIDLDCEDIGEQQLKNIARPVRAYHVRPDRIGPTSATAPALPEKPSIAVLPFLNMSGDPEQEYFADGMTEDLITDLSKVSGLFVIARNSSFTYKGKAVDVKRIGRELGVRHVLEGSVRKAGNRVRITAQLIDTGSGGHVWAERFDRDLTDIFSMEDEVIEKIVRALAVTLTQGEERRLRQRGTGNVAAYESWLRARELLTGGTRDSVVQARALYQGAIEIDPNFAAPHAGLGLAAVLDYINDWAADPTQALDEAERWARRALELNDQEPLSHMALGNVLLWRRDHERALAEFGRMIALDPNFAQGHTAAGMALVYSGRAAEALEPIATAMRLDPHYAPIVLHFLAQANFSLGAYDTAARLLLERIARNPGTDASRMLLASCYGHLGRAEDARITWAGLLKVNPDFSLEQRARVLPYKDPADFQRIAEGLAKAGLP